MANSESNTFDIENILQINNKIFISLLDCDVNLLKKITQTNIQYMSKYSGAYCVLQLDGDAADTNMKLAIDMLVARNLISVFNGENIDELLATIANAGKKKVFLAVRNMRQRNDFINAGKKAGVFVDFCLINDDGSIEKWSPRKEDARVSRKVHYNGNQKNDNERKCRKREKPYVIKNVPEQINIKQILVDNRLDVGSVVYDSTGKEYRLVEKILDNNGASTYKTDVRGMWVKLYDNDNLNTFLESKIHRMIQNPINFNGICWPLSIATDGQKVFRGYFMNDAAGEPLHLSVMKKAGIEKNFPNWNKINLCDLALTILVKIDYLHRNGILMGCINPAAIRVVDDNTVYFADTDNYQVEGFPSFVYNISFTPPELLGRKIYLTDVDSENFAIAELIFMIMMTGKTPYAVGINGNPELEIKKMYFPYSNKKVHGNAALPSMWRFMWSHLTPFKEPFYETFQKDGRYNKQGQRRGPKFWINITKDFKADLENPVDRESLKIYPQTFKKGRNDTFYKCRFCGVEHPKFYFSNQFFDEYRICNDCIGKQSDVSFTCVDCGKTYYYTNRTALFHKQKREQDSSWKDQKHCRDCKEKTLTCVCCGEELPFYQLRNGMCLECSSNYRNQVYQRIQCRVCGSVFDFTNGDRDFYAKKGYSLPTKCPNCRKGGNLGGYNGGRINGSSCGSNGSSRKNFWEKLFGK